MKRLIPILAIVLALAAATDACECTMGRGRSVTKMQFEIVNAAPTVAVQPTIVEVPMTVYIPVAVQTVAVQTQPVNTINVPVDPNPAPTTQQSDVPPPPPPQDAPQAVQPRALPAPQVATYSAPAVRYYAQPQVTQYYAPAVTTYYAQPRVTTYYQTAYYAPAVAPQQLVIQQAAGTEIIKTKIRAGGLFR